MSYNNVIGGKLKLKGKALDVKAGGMKKKKKRSKESSEQALLHLKEQEESEHGSDGDEMKGSSADWDREQGEGGNERQLTVYEDHRTPAEKKYDEQRIQLETRRLAKVASKSHRQKIEEFNQYLANLSEHYDIPKVNAAVVLHKTMDATTEDILDHCKKNLAAFKIPKRLFFGDTVPQTATGKIQRRFVAEHFLSKATESTSG